MAVLLYLGLAVVTGFQLHQQSQRVGLKASTGSLASALGGMGFELSIDETRSAAFIGGSGEERKQSDDTGFSREPRGFNNPNLQVTVKFKNKVKSNLFEFIVTIEPENGRKDSYDEEMGDRQTRDGDSSQHKVKRYLYEFEELFNHLENQNPKDDNLRQFDYN